MALAHVQTNGVDNQPGPSTAVAFSTNVTAGNVLFCDIAYESTGPVTAVTDSLGNTWVSRKVAVGTTFKVESWSTVSGASGACTVTVACAGSRQAIALSEYSGLGAHSVDQSNNHENTSAVTSHTCGSITTTQIGLIRALYRFAGVYTTSTPPSGYNARRDNGATRQIVVYDKIASGTETTNPTLVTSGGVGDHGVVYNVYAAASAAATARITQLVAETLSSHPTPDARAGQLVVETLTSLAAALPPDARVSQLVVETLSKEPLAEGRVGQLVVETLSPSLTEAYVSQLVAETLTQYHAETITLSQLLVETLIKIPLSPIRVSQSPLEILDQYPTVARVSQSPVELAQQHVASLTLARVSQAPLEIIYPFGCYTYIPPPCPAGATAFPIDEDSEGSCADGLPTDPDV